MTSPAWRDFLANVCTPAWHAQQDLGKPIDEACAELAQQHPGQAALIRAWAERNEEMVSGPVDAQRQLLRRSWRPVSAVTPSPTWRGRAFERRLRLYEFFELFDGYFVSALEGVRKPDPRYLQAGSGALRAVPEETLFTDDKRKTWPPPTLGLPAVVFSGAALFRENWSPGVS